VTQMDPDLAAALVAAQADLQDPVRAKKGQVKGKKDYRYAGLDDVLQTVRPVLTKHGLAITQTFEVCDGQTLLRTTLVHAGGGTHSGTFPMRWPDDPQQQGSAATYARRYSLEGILGIAATDDDDASSAAEDEPTAKKESKPDTVIAKADTETIDQLVKDEWAPRERVIPEMRDFCRWLGIDADPWAATPERQRKLPNFVKEKQTELDAWVAWRGDLADLLQGAKLGANDLSSWLDTSGKPQVNEMSRDEREKLLGFLRDAKGLKRVQDFINQQRQEAA